MNKLLIISGPTATGKTSLALKLAELFNGELISADSRQVYKEMNIGTGKEWGVKSKKQKAKSKINIWGYDVVSPNEEWSAAHFVRYANKIIADIDKRKKLPIIVGGTGLYINNLLQPPKTLFTPQDLSLRLKLEKLNIQQLQNKFRRMNQQRFNNMNESDQKNPRRLIRAIEVVKFTKLHKSNGDFVNFRPDALHIGITAPTREIDHRIKNRVADRIKQGLEQEVKTLVKKYGWNSILSTTIAYQEWRPYLKNEITLEKVIETWTTHEKQYARRQITWLKKYQPRQWFDITDTSFLKNIVSRVRQWYDQANVDRQIKTSA